jgi:hypothetical protein
MRAWKPEMAPQAIVMKQNGKIVPAKTGKCRHEAGERGIWIVGRTSKIPPAAQTTATLMKEKVVAWRE